MKSRQRLLSILLALCLVLTMLPVGSLPVLAVNGELAGDGSPENPYQIADAEDLKAFRDLVNGGDSDAWAVLTADIDLNPGITFTATGALEGTTPESWTPIGDYDYYEDGVQYTGTFDGGGHTISGLYINDSSAIGQGLFSYVGSGGTVENVGVENSYISARNSVGGVVGYNEGIVQNSYNTGAVIGGDNACVGGVVGDNDGVVQDSYNTGAVTGGGSARMGGVVGISYGTIQNCYNTGTVTGSHYVNVGGVVGDNSGTLQTSYNAGQVIGGDNAFVGGVAGSNYGTIQASYNAGEVTGGNFLGSITGIGGVVGSNYETIQNSYNTGKVSGDSYYTGGVAGRADDNTVINSYYLDACGAAGAGTSYTEAQMKAADFITTLNGDQDPTPWQRDYNGSSGYYNSQYPILDWQAPFTGGTGVNGDPFLIATKEDLTYFASLVNGGRRSIWGKLTANIDLNPGFTFADDGSYTGPEGAQPETWNTMGRSETEGVYSGTFDGDGYAVSGVYINTNTGCQGLFGSITGTVRNLRVENSYISSGSGNSAGGIVAINWTGTVENCAFSGSVRGGNRVGGIVGRNRDGIVQNCYNTGTIRASGNGNGIAGTNNERSAQVINCFTTTGFIAEGGNITNSYYLSDNSSAAEALTTEELIGPNAVATMGFDSSVWTSGGQSQWEEIELGDSTVANILCGYLPHPSVFDGKQDFDWVALDSDTAMSTQTDADGKTYYLIENAAQLAAFRNIVNGTLTAEEALIYTPDTSANGRLVNDIDLNPGYTFAADGSYTYSGEGEAPSVQSWTPIGGYTGTFDGNGHTVSGMYINNISVINQGLFGVVSRGGTVQNLGVVNSYVFSYDYVGSVVGYNIGTVQNCYNTGAVVATSTLAYVGGVVGENDGTVQNCYNTGAVTGTDARAYVGGVVGYNDGTVQNCYNTGTISSDSANKGGIVGGNNGNVTNCYYLNTSASTGIGDGTSEATSLTAEQMTGSDALGQGETQMNLDTTVWTTGDDATFWQDTGTLDENGQRVFGLIAKLPQLTVFVNAGKGHELLQAGTTTPGLSTQTDEDGKTYYLIENKEELETFRNIVNNTLTAEEAQFYTADASANGRLVNDIDLNPGYTFHADGTYSYSGEGEAPGVQSWTPIGDSSLQYSGTFDGNGKTVSGIYINDSFYNQGLLGYVRNGGTVQNLGVVNSYVSGDAWVGGVVGYNIGTVQNCYNTGAVVATEWGAYVGGVVGENYGTVQNCYNTGAVSASNDYASIGGIVGENYGDATNCYFLEGTADQGIGSGFGSGSATALTAAQMSGTAAQTNMTGFDFTDTWGIRAETNTVQTGEAGETSVSVTVTTTSYAPYLRVFGEDSAPALSNAVSQTEKMQQQTDNDGKTYYLIYNKAQLELFRNIVNGTLSAQEQLLYPEGAFANGRLENDIDLNPGYTFAADGTYTYSGEGEAPGVQSWTPMGTSSRGYIGIFDGNGKTVSGIYINDSSYYQGLFGYVSSGGTVQNLGVVNSYVFSSDFVGGVVGDNNGTVQNCYNTGAVAAASSLAYVGGVVGFNGGTVQNCYNTGVVTGTNDRAYVGGVVGANNGTVQNCYNTGTVSASGDDANIGSIVGGSYDTVTNCYFLEGTASSGIGSGSGGATSLTIAQIEDTGETGLLASLVSGVPADEENPWNTQLSAMGNWEYGKPAVQPVFTWQTVIQNAPTYSVTIPETATVDGNAVTVSADAGALRADQTVEVAVDETNSFALTNGGSGQLSYQVFAGESTTAVSAGQTVLTAANTGGNTRQVSIRFGLSGTPVYAGTYSGTCTFAVSVKQSASE